jgi:uncharacterized protein
MYLNLRERRHLRSLMAPLSQRPEVQQMKDFTQHGKVTTYDHCHRVAERCFWLSRRLGWRVDEEALITGALLHDFYLYDWHEERPGGKLHGFTHPAAACENARKVFHVGKKEQSIILSHMWPIPGAPLPRSKEAWLVCLADKICFIREIHRKKNKAGRAKGTQK